jgi:hypothetical protein
MISFKEFLKRKEVLNEELKDDFKKLFADKDNGEKAKAVNNWLKNNKKTDFLNKKTDFRIEVAKKINEKLPENQKINVKDEKEIDEIVTKINNLYERSKNKKEGNVGKKKLEFVTTLLDNSTEIRSIEPVDVKNVLKCFSKNNINGDTRIDKKEFIEAIKEIKKLKELDINKAAVILWLAYFRQCIIGAKGEVSDEVLITSEGALSKQFIEALQKQNTNNNYFDDNSIKDLKNIFAGFGKFQMEPSVLINFKSISSAKSFLKKSNEELEKIEGKFTEKTPEEKETEKQEEDVEKAKEEKKADTENQIKDLDAENAKLDRQSDELDKKADALKNDSSSKEEVDLINDIVKKRNWYIFSTKPPKPGKEEELPEFISNIKKEVEEFLNKIGDGLEKFRVNKTSDADLAIEKPKDEQPSTEQPEVNASVKEMIKNCIKKNGILVEDNDTFGKEFDRYQEQIEEIKTSTKERIDKILMKLSRKAQNINKDLEKENNYKMAVELQSDFKSLFIEYGYDIASEIERAIKRGNDILKAAKKNKNSDEVRNYKTADQKGQEQMDIKNITKALTGSYNNDPANLARYLLINLLNKLESSKEVLRQLQKASFDEEMFTNGYIFAGSSGKVYAPPMAKPFSCGELKIFSYPVEQTMSFKNPEALLKNIGINVNSLTVDVMKGVKEIASGDGLKAEAEKYWKAADEIYKTISNLKKSIVTEEYEYINKDAKEHLEKLGVNTNNVKIKDMEETEESKKMGNWLNGNIQKKQDSISKSDKQDSMSQDDKLSSLQSNLQQLLNGICSKLDLNAEYQQDGMGPEDIALRQFLKGYVLIVHGNDRYITSMKLYKEYEQFFKQAADESKTDTDAVTSKSGQVGKNVMPADKEENKVKVDGSADEGVPASIVTSANADSTYGDGYGYSKKAKAIKKKLNSTTYTYSPNSKLKIVRRTFD